MRVFIVEHMENGHNVIAYISESLCGAIRFMKKNRNFSDGKLPWFWSISVEELDSKVLPQVMFFDMNAKRIEKGENYETV